MLVLTRKLQEQISIGQDITITILRVKGNTVRIGIDAPEGVRVLRGELPRHETPRRQETPLLKTPGRDTTRTIADDSRGASVLGPLDATGRQHPAPRVGTRSTGLKPIVQRLGQRAADVAVLGVAAPVLVD